ncbi:MAG: putative ATP-grasp superfamily ATP-dependent carboligase [Gammaproteobacteria bacterium]|jgi:predicted ATP-grasp superfamily ATP-dependent carboligase
MKRIFICEFITCGGMRDSDLPVSLLDDAECMFQALLSDLRQIACLDIITCRDDRLSAVAESVARITEADDVWLQWKNCMDMADIVWIIAPETDGILLRLNKLARQSDCLLIACDDDAVILTSSKYATNEHLIKNGIPASLSKKLNEELIPGDGAWVIKPDDGVGSERCHFFETNTEILSWMQEIEDNSQYLQQRYIPGIPASLSVVYADHETLLLSCNRQVMTLKQGKFFNEGIVLNDMHEHHAEFETLAREIGKHIPGLRGYVGIDVVMSDTGPIVLDINPRLTKSYVGLSKLLDVNIAELTINLLLYPVRVKPEGNHQKFMMQSEF